jgi:flagellar biosynthesis/type III secretory pathway protein FliH
MNSSSNPSENSRPIRLGRILHNVRIEGAPAAIGEPTAPATPNPAHPATPSTSAPANYAAIADASYQQGRKEGRAEALRELSQTVQVLRNAARAYESEKLRLSGDADEQSVTLALAIAKKILGREIRDGEAIRGVLRRALTQAPARQALRARLNPDDLRMIESTRDQLRKINEPLPEELVLCADPHIARGGCVLESAAGQVDARLETQLGLIEQALRGLEPQGINDGSGNRPAEPGQQT